MQLPFRYQFILAPTITVILLACLVAYTSYELSRIYNQNEATVYWEILHDDIQTAIATTNTLNNTIGNLSSEQSAQQDDVFFAYLEQSQFLSDRLRDENLLELFPDNLQQKISSTQNLLHEPERVDPTTLLNSINLLLPDLEYQAKIIAASRRSAYIDNHQKLISIISRLTTVQIATLIICIIFATSLAVWGLFVIRQRFHKLQTRAQLVCQNTNSSANRIEGDELDNLEACLVSMTDKLLKTISVENVLHGVENERRRIAMDMHDGVLADLTAINRQLEPNTSMRADIDSIINDLRRTIDDLHPQVLEILGLKAALQSWLERQHAPQYHFDFPDEIEQSLSLEQKINLFRITTETATNIIKHAHAERFEVIFRIHNHTLVVSVEDNGIGMPKEIDHTGHGYANIKERAQVLNADVLWKQSRFATGTCFELTMALKQ